MATVGSAIVCDRLQLYGNRSLCDRLRSAIVCDHMETSLYSIPKLGYFVMQFGHVWTVIDEYD